MFLEPTFITSSNISQDKQSVSLFVDIDLNQRLALPFNLGNRRFNINSLFSHENFSILQL